LDEIYLSMQLTDWLLVEVALLLICLTQISFVKTGLTVQEDINRLLDSALVRICCGGEKPVQVRIF
jgi:hypothetical protein